MGLIATVVALAVVLSGIVMVQVRQTMPEASASESAPTIPANVLVVDDGAVVDETPEGNQAANTDETESGMYSLDRSGAKVVRTPGLPTVTYRVKTKQKVFFITVDDGTYKNPAAAAWVKSNEIPITSFVTSSTIGPASAIPGQVGFFEKVSSFGSIQNHSATHKSLNKSSTDLEHEICYVQRRYKKLFGTQPWMLRPPYGDGPTNRAMLSTAKSCGISEIVMWDTSVNNGKVSYRYGKPAKGSIFLMHFTKNFAKDLKLAVATGRKYGLKPANLAEYLPQPAKNAS